MFIPTQRTYVNGITGKWYSVNNTKHSFHITKTYPNVRPIQKR